MTVEVGELQLSSGSVSPNPGSPSASASAHVVVSRTSSSSSAERLRLSKRKQSRPVRSIKKDGLMTPPLSSADENSLLLLSSKTFVLDFSAVLLKSSAEESADHAVAASASLAAEVKKGLAQAQVQDSSEAEDMGKKAILYFPNKQKQNKAKQILTSFSCLLSFPLSLSLSLLLLACCLCVLDEIVHRPERVGKGVVPVDQHEPLDLRQVAGVSAEGGAQGRPQACL